MKLATTDVTGITIDRAGVTGNNVSGGGAGLPHWQINSLVTFSGGPLSLTLEGRFIDDGVFDATLIGPEQEGYNVNLPNSINTNHVASSVYVNLGARYKLPTAGGEQLRAVRRRPEPARSRSFGCAEQSGRDEHDSVRPARPRVPRRIPDGVLGAWRRLR